MKKYKKSYFVINIILSVTIIFMLFNTLFIKNTNFWFSCLLEFIPFLIICLIYGYEKKKRRFTYESMFSVFRYCFIYLVLIYILGIFVGFNKNIYVLNFSNLIHNIIPYIVLLLIGELLRYEISRKGENSILSNILVTVIMILVDCTVFLTTFNLSTGDGVTQYVCYIVIPSISKNGFLLYLTRIGGPFPCILYRVIMDLKLFILPLFPDFGLYIDSILMLLFPQFVGFSTYKSYDKYRNKLIDSKGLKKSVIFIYILTFIVGIFLVVVILLNSGKFKYGILSIGSGSMTGSINKGDSIIYESVNDKKKIKVGKVLVFKKDGKTIVHRIIKRVKISEKETVYYTKGDANNSPDGYPIGENDIVGVVTFRIALIGIPSVSYNELINR